MHVTEVIGVTVQYYFAKDMINDYSTCTARGMHGMCYGVGDIRGVAGRVIGKCLH